MGDLEINWTFVLMGVLGGLLPDLLRLIKVLRQPKIKKVFSKPGFYLSWVGLGLVGGIAAGLLDSQSVKEALLIGFSGPEILSALASRKKEEIETKGGKETFDVRNWWSN